MIKLTDIINELEINKPINRKYVFALCDYNGEFTRLRMIKESEILHWGEDIEDGPYIKLKEDEEEDYNTYYLEYIQI